MKKTKEQLYLESLSPDQLFQLLEATIRHSHYCPCECHCFDNWKYRYSISEITNQIRNLILNEYKEQYDAGYKSGLDFN